jgi:hypothetical protein
MKTALLVAAAVVLGVAALVVVVATHKADPPSTDLLIAVYCAEGRNGIAWSMAGRRPCARNVHKRLARARFHWWRQSSTPGTTADRHCLLGRVLFPILDENRTDSGASVVYRRRV